MVIRILAKVGFKNSEEIHHTLERITVTVDTNLSAQKIAGRPEHQQFILDELNMIYPILELR